MFGVNIMQNVKNISSQQGCALSDYRQKRSIWSLYLAAPLCDISHSRILLPAAD